MKKPTRRELIGSTVAIAGATALTSSEKAYAISKRSSADLINVGLIACGINSHHYIWGPMINPTDDDTWPVGREKKNIIGANSTNAAGEWPQHGVHGLYYLLAILGMDVGMVSFQADGWWREPTSGETRF